jgi:hypothetical protein
MAEWEAAPPVNLSVALFLGTYKPRQAAKPKPGDLLDSFED